MSGGTFLAQATPIPAPGPTGSGTTAPPPEAPPTPGAPASIFVGVVLAAIAALLVAAAIKLARRGKATRALPPAREDLRARPPHAPARPEAEPAPRAPPREKPAPRPDLRELTPEERSAEERRRKETYRADKEAKVAERERRARERAEEEAARLRALEEQRLRQEALEREQAESARRKIEAESGKTLLEGLTRTREGGFVARLSGLFGGQAQVSEATLSELEEILFTADIGVRTSMSLVEHARGRLRARELSDPGRLRSAIRSDIESILERAQDGSAVKAVPGLGLPLDEARRPWVIMVVGVNGAGKTTTIGKLASKMKARGKSVLLAAGDTFRAAATEQLDVWADRAKVPLVRGPEHGDPGAVMFEAIQRARAEDLDVVIADTAGRLHTKAPLMEELKKVKRVMSKAREGAPDEVLLVLDATTGQNAIQQARQFHEALGVTGIVLTKLDGTAKGGVVIGIADELSIPVRLVGIGESLADLRPFDPHEFVDALFGPESRT